MNINRKPSNIATTIDGHKVILRREHLATKDSIETRYLRSLELKTNYNIKDTVLIK